MVDGLVEFVKSKETEHINARYEKDLAALTAQIDEKKGDVKPKQVKKREEHHEESLEEQMTVLLKKIHSKSRTIKLQKDDFESYSDAQS